MPKLLVLMITGPNASLNLAGEGRGGPDEKTMMNPVELLICFPK
jgi:hypothetical protein